MNQWTITGIFAGTAFLIGYITALWTVKDNNKIAMTIIKYLRRWDR